MENIHQKAWSLTEDRISIINKLYMGDAALRITISRWRGAPAGPNYTPIALISLFIGNRIPKEL